MRETDQEGNRVRTELIEEYRTYFALLRDYQEGNHQKILEVLHRIRSIQHEYQQTAGATATSKLFRECHDTVLSENTWAIRQTFGQIVRLGTLPIIDICGNNNRR